MRHTCNCNVNTINMLNAHGIQIAAGAVAAMRRCSLSAAPPPANSEKGAGMIKLPLNRPEHRNIDLCQTSSARTSKGCLAYFIARLRCLRGTQDACTLASRWRAY